MIRPGDPAPDFSLKAQDGTGVSLSSLKGKPVVLFFYPKDHTPTCTKEACTFRDRHADFRTLGAEVLGISSDDEASHRRFSVDYKLTFPLLSDPGGTVRKRYGVPKVLGLLPGRATFVIDREGIVRLAYSAAFEAEAHVLRALEALKSP